MKKTILLFLTFVALSLNAQIKINYNGNIGIGTTNPTHAIDLNISNNTLRFDLWSDIFINKSGLCNSPVIYPEKDWYLQLGKSSNQIGTIYASSIHVSKLFTDSDSTYKCNFRNIEGEKERFRKLKPYKYNFKKEYVNKIPIKERNKVDHGQFGFKAQDIESLYPELIYKDDSTGKYSIDYIGFIPILVNMIQELQDVVEKQEQKIKALEITNTNKEKSNNNKTKEKQNNKHEYNNPKTSTYNTAETSKFDELNNVGFLYQNSPNPFSKETEIKYFIPEYSQSAYLYIFTLQGKMLLSKKIETKGDGYITIEASEFNPGMYIYTLAIDGKETDTKRMIITQE